MENINKDEEILEFKVVQHGLTSQLYQGNIISSYMISPVSIQMVVTLDDEQDIQTWNKINIRSTHKQLYHEFIDRFNLLKKYCTQEVKSNERFNIQLRYKTRVDVYNFDGLFTSYDPLLVSILFRIIDFNRQNDALIESKPITYDVISNTKPEDIKFITMVLNPENEFSHCDEMYLLTKDDVLYYTPFIDNNVGSHEICKKIFKNFNDVDLRNFSEFSYENLYFTILSMKENEYIICNKYDGIDYYYQFAHLYMNEISKKFKKFLTNETNVPTKVIERTKLNANNVR